MRATGDPITAALGGKLTPDAAGRAHPPGRLRPAADHPVLRVPRLSVFTGNFGTTLSDNQPVIHVLLTYGAATLELAFYALIVAFIVGIPLGMVAAYYRDKGRDASLRIFAILCYATPVFFAGLLLKLIFSIWLNWLPVAGRASTSSELEMQTLPNKTGIYLIDSFLTGDPSVTRRRAPARHPAGDHARSADGRRVPPPRAHERHRDALHRLRRCGPLARRQRVPARPPTRVQAGPHPDHHGHRPADRDPARAARC